MIDLEKTELPLEEKLYDHLTLVLNPNENLYRGIRINYFEHKNN
jgi:hypothetical protein